MLTATTKKVTIILLSAFLVACSGHKINNYILIDDDKSPMLDSNILYSEVIHLNNFATSFGDYLYVNSTYTEIVFSDKDEHGNYHSWKKPESLFLDTTRIYNVFKYADKLVCICKNREGNDEVIIYNSDFSIYKRKKFDRIIPKYLCNDLLYGFTYPLDSKLASIISINLNSLEQTEIFSYEKAKGIDFIVSSREDIIVVENSKESNTLYSKYKDGSLSPILKTKSSSPIFYDSRGLFYLEDNNTASENNLMLWNGNESHKIESISVDDMNQWVFANGIPGNVIIFDDFFASIHYASESPYLLIQGVNSKDSKRVPFEKWSFSEVDMDRNGETFSGIYYENGQLVNYFFSETLGVLQTQIFEMHPSTP